MTGTEAMEIANWKTIKITPRPKICFEAQILFFVKKAIICAHA